jgi:hypothetical protein
VVNVRGVARMGISPVGLGIGAAVPYPAVPSADSLSVCLSSIESFFGGGDLPAPSSGVDLAISFDGYSLVSDGTANAETTCWDCGPGSRRHQRYCRCRRGLLRHWREGGRCPAASGDCEQSAKNPLRRLCHRCLAG